MKLYNTRTKQIELFQPLDGQTARLYSCGPTVYDHAHIGNLASFVFADTLRRVIGLSNDVKQVMNYTDIDDKTIRRSHETYPNESPRVALQKLTDHYIALFMEDMQKIGNHNNAIIFMRATDHIDDMKTLITELHQGGFAYVADDGVYFSIEAYRKSGKIYGQLLKIAASNTSAARIQNDEYDKESAHDFALWKKQKDDEPAWEFMLDGHDVTGRPGWHIECSAMSRQALGQPFDIHTGGIDLIFPHHENEIAQSTALQDNPIMARIFTHTEHILIDGKKMAKSAQNFYTLQDIITKGYDPLAFRLLVLQGHYRHQLNFTWESLMAAQNSLKNMRNNFSWVYQSETTGTPQDDLAKNFSSFKQKIRQVLEDDVDTPKAIALLHACADDFATASASRLDIPVVEDFAKFIEQALGITIIDPDHQLPAAQKKLIDQREQARASKDFAKADTLRDELAKQGIGVSDRPSGVIWYRL